MKSYLKTMTQTLHKRLSMPLLFTVISTIGIGVSSPARSATLAGSQSTIIDANPEATLIAGNQCPNGMSPDFPPPCWRPSSERDRVVDEQSPSKKPAIEKPTIKKPAIEKPTIEKPAIDKPAIEKPNVEKPADENRIRYHRQRLQQQQPIGEPSPNAEPSLQN